MKKSFLIASVIVIAACASHKKSAKSATASSTPNPPVNTTLSSPAPVPATNTSPSVKPVNGIYPPGNEELAAIQTQYKDATLSQLQEGHTLYTQSACIQCHEPMNIYVHSVAQWKDIIGDMAQRAGITDGQREAVYKYVLAIKAAQAK